MTLNIVLPFPDAVVGIFTLVSSLLLQGFAQPLAITNVEEPHML